MSRQPRAQGLLTIAALAAGSATAAWLGFAVWIRFPGGAGLLEDDSYFYAQIAYNLGTANLSSFDGFSITDGYHLLWGWTLAIASAVTALVTTGKLVHLGVMIAVYFFTAAITGYLFGRTLVGRVAIPFFAIVYSGLTEGPLLALLLLTFLWNVLLTERGPSDGGRAGSYAGYLAAVLIPLTRIDASLIVVLLAMALALDGRRREAVRVVICLAAGISAQLAAMYLTAGHFVSVSARAKVLPGGWSGVLTTFVGSFDRYALLTLGLLAVTFVVLRWSPQPSASRARGAVVAVAIYLLGQMAFNGNVRYWYYMPALMVSVALLDRFVEARLRWAFVALVATLMLGFGAVKLRYVQTYGNEVRYAARFVDELRSRVPTGERVFVTDGAGYLGYFSERAVVDGDGLVNTHAFGERLRANRLDNYLVEEGIRYVVLNRYTIDDTLLDYHGLRLTRADVVTLEEPPPGLRKLVAFGLYRLK